MENASKALIIAGAILITLIIIGLGVAILGSTEGATDTSTFDAMQVSSFNNKFKPYEGTITGSKLDALCDILIATARSGKTNDERPNIILKPDGANGWSVKDDNDVQLQEPHDDTNTAAYTKFVKALKKDIQTSERYTVTMTEDPNTDLIHTITITK